MSAEYVQDIQNAPEIVFAGEHWVRWSTAAAERYPQLAELIATFDAGPLAAARTAARWLREEGLAGESIAYLLIEDDQLLGFYALTAGQVELSTTHSKQLGVTRPTQGAILVTQLAKSAQHDVDGGRLVNDAIGVAAEQAKHVAATVLAVDPFDQATASMWRDRFKLRNSRTVVPGHDGSLKRMYLALPPA